ncbi:ATP-NAD kinase-like domain-containing protein [Lipomyces arxii]|uniref:ATP-NAD kinase-like domain-containing protein n=1 Tax=Lipomyces arxii TaxID=56418 RepID=UPI0034CF18A6
MVGINSTVAYTLDHKRVVLTLEERFLLIDYEYSSSGSTLGCFSSVACINSSFHSSIRHESIVYYNIIWAELASARAQTQLLCLRIDYCIVKNDLKATFSRSSFLVDGSEEQNCRAFTEALMNRAYRNTIRCKRLLVLINPFGGQGKATDRFLKLSLPIFDAARCHVDQIKTEYKGHAMDLIENMEGLEDRYDAIVCCSGDGIPHEVFNGLSKRKNAGLAFRVPVCQLPCGSGNALCVNLVGSNDLPFATLSTVKGVPIPVDLCSLTQGDKRYVTFLSQALGMIADCDLGTENMRWMGESRFTVGLVMRVLSRAKYPCEVSVRIAHESRSQVRRAYQEDKSKNHERYDDSVDAEAVASRSLPSLRYGTINDPVPEDWKIINTSTLAIFYAGKMPWMSSDALFFPAALPRDGYVDLVLIDSAIPRLEVLSILLNVQEGKHFDSKQIHYYKVDAYRVTPKAHSGFISIDGEKFDFTPFQVEVHPSLGTVLSRTGFYQAPGV